MPKPRVLPVPGLGLADDVVPGERDREGHGLDRERRRDAVAGERRDDVGVDREVGEGLHVRRGLLGGLDGDLVGDRLGAASGQQGWSGCRSWELSDRRRHAREASRRCGGPIGVLRAGPEIAGPHTVVVVLIVPTGHRGPVQPTVRMPSAPPRAMARLPTMETNAATGLEDPAYRAAVVDLLGVLAYGELTACIRMATDSDLAPSLRIKAQDGGVRRGRVPPVRAARRPARRRSAPRPRSRCSRSSRRSRPSTPARRRRSWVEGLVKAYVGDGIAKDFYREMASFVDEETRGGHGPRARRRRHRGVHRRGRARHDPDRPDRQGPAQPVGTPAARRGAEPGAGGRRGARRPLRACSSAAGPTSPQIGEMFTRLTDRHSERMARLGLTP